MIIENLPIILIILGAAIAAGDYLLPFELPPFGFGPSKKLLILGVLLIIIGIAILVLRNL